MPKAVFQTIYNDIKKGIENGAFQYQSLLLSENEFAKQYCCSRSTIRRALQELTLDGYVQPIQGKGVRVIWKPTGEDTLSVSTVGLESFAEQGRRIGFKTETKLISFKHIEADEKVSRETSFPVGEALVEIERVRLADGVPVTTDHTYYLESEIPGLTPEIAMVSTYQYIENELGLKIVTSKRTITMEHATDSDMRYIQPPMNLPAVAVVRGRSFDSAGVMFEHSESRQHPYFFSYSETAIRPNH